jgi:hypothetical protein
MKDQKTPFLMAGCKVADGYGTMLVRYLASLLILLLCSETCVFQKKEARNVQYCRGTRTSLTCGSCHSGTLLSVGRVLLQYCRGGLSRPVPT